MFNVQCSSEQRGDIPLGWQLNIERWSDLAPRLSRIADPGPAADGEAVSNGLSNEVFAQLYRFSG